MPSLIWFGMVAGFGVDMPRFLHESPPSAAVVDVHAVVFTVWLLLLTAQVLLVVGDRMALHRRLGWFMVGWAGLMVVLGVWTAMVAKFSVVGEFARVGAPRSSTSKTRTKWPPSSSPEEAKTLLEEGRFCSIFLGVVGPSFLLGFSQKTSGRTWFFDGEFVVDCW